MRDEKEQDREIGHATQGKTGTHDGKHKSRNSSRTTRINYTKHNNASIITDSITKHVAGSITITNKENQETRKSRQKPTRHQRTHATYRTSTNISGIGFIQEYEAEPEILVAAVTQQNTSDDNANGKKGEMGKVGLEEIGNGTAWNNQQEGLVTKMRKTKENETRNRTGNS
jgi:hypothetical protein